MVTKVSSRECREAALRKTRASVRKIEVILLRKRSAVLKGLCGFLLSVIGCISLAIDPFAMSLRYYMKLTEGSESYNLWKSPPMGGYLKTYVFNMTNPKEFITGQDSKIKFEEIGPFTYLEMRRNENMTIDKERGVLSFIPKRSIKFIPELSIGDPKDYNITVPNHPFLSIASMLAKESFIVNMALNLLLSHTKTESTVNLTIDQFLWGYNDPLVEMAHSVLPGWIDFAKFGILDRIYDDKNEIVEVELSDPKKMYSIKSWDGERGMRQWGYTTTKNSRCNLIDGSYEGILFPNNMPKKEHLFIYRKQTCRTLEAEYYGEALTSFGVKVREYRPVKDAINTKAPNNKCMCKGECLPNGLSPAGPCYYDLPLALSYPHFLDADPIVFNKLEGFKPNREEHGSRMFIEPMYGLPMAGVSSSQSNSIIKDVSYNAKAKPFSNMVLPIVWMKMELQDIPKSDVKRMLWMYIYAPNIFFGIELTMIIIGLCIWAWQTYRYINPFFTFRGKEMDYSSLIVNDAKEGKELNVLHENPLLIDSDS